MTAVAVIHTGTANLASVLAGIERAGGSPRVIQAPGDICEATHLVLPGVGSFGTAMARLRETGWSNFINGWIDEDRPCLAICVGLQALFDSSDESPGSSGLGVLSGSVERIADGRTIAVPQMGWNEVRVEGDARFLRSGWAFFANSFCVRSEVHAGAIAIADYGRPFVAGVERGRLLACQFHPELSAGWGIEIISRWLQEGAGPSRSEARSIRAWRPRTRPQMRVAPLPARIIPCLDVRDGRVVKGVRFQNLRDAGDPVECAREYEMQGADELVILDVSATAEGRRAALDTVRAVRETISIPLTVGGGVRGRDDACALLDAGADKVSVNTAAVADPGLLGTLCEDFGRQCTILAIDAARSDRAAGGFEVVTHAGTKKTGIDAVEWAREAVRRGAGEILLTSFDRDGTRSGYDLDLLRAITSAVTVPVIASGGAAHAQHLAKAIESGADAVLAASIFHDRQTTVEAIKAELKGLGCATRPSRDYSASQ